MPTLPGFPLILGFLAGSIPFGLLLVRILFRKDLRREGSGNIGATNAARCAPVRWRIPFFLLVWALDAAKGFLPVLWVLGSVDAGRRPEILQGVLTGAAAVAGHVFSPFLGGRGGKGVATTSGVFLALDPLAFALGVAVFLTSFLFLRIVAIASILMGFTLALASMLRDPEAALGARLPLSLAACLLASTLVWTHRSNLRALRRSHRTEPRA